MLATINASLMDKEKKQSAINRKQKLRNALKKANRGHFKEKNNQTILELIKESEGEDENQEKNQSGQITDDIDADYEFIQEQINSSPSLLSIIAKSDITILIKLFLFQLAKITFMFLFALSAFLVVYYLIQNIIPWVKTLLKLLV